MLGFLRGGRSWYFEYIRDLGEIRGLFCIEKQLLINKQTAKIRMTSTLCNLLRWAVH